MNSTVSFKYLVKICNKHTFGSLERPFKNTAGLVVSETDLQDISKSPQWTIFGISKILDIFANIKYYIYFPKLSKSENTRHSDLESASHMLMGPVNN